MNQIIIRCAVKLQNAIDKYSNPRKYANKVARQLNSGKTLSTVFLFSRLLNFSSANLYSPEELKTMILRDIRPGIDGNTKEITTVDDLTKEILSNKFISGSILSKVYNEFMRNGLLIHYNKKDQLEIFRALHVKVHKNIYKTKGRISFYTISPEAEMTKKLLGNPKAVEIIDSSLKKSGLLDRGLKLLVKATIYLLIRANHKETDNLKKVVVALCKGVYPGIHLDMRLGLIYRNIIFTRSEYDRKGSRNVSSVDRGKIGFSLHHIWTIYIRRRIKSIAIIINYF